MKHVCAKTTLLLGDRGDVVWCYVCGRVKIGTVKLTPENARKPKPGARR